MQVQICRLPFPPPTPPPDTVIKPFIPSLSLYTFEVSPLILLLSHALTDPLLHCLHISHISPCPTQPPPYARPREAAAAAAAVGTCMEEPLSFAASVLGVVKHALFWRRFRYPIPSAFGARAATSDAARESTGEN